MGGGERGICLGDRINSALQRLQRAFDIFGFERLADDRLPGEAFGQHGRDVVPGGETGCYSWSKIRSLTDKWCLPASKYHPVKRTQNVHAC
jgi:hypothetical protein